MNDDLATATNFRSVQLTNRIAALDLMKAKTREMLEELEPDATHEREHSGSRSSSILQMYVSRLDQSAEVRCQNLRSTLRAIERERVRAKSELNMASLVDGAGQW